MNPNNNVLFCYENNQDQVLLLDSNTTKPQYFAASSCYILNFSLPLLEYLGTLTSPSLALSHAHPWHTTSHSQASGLAINGTLSWPAWPSLALYNGTLTLLAWPSLPSQLASRYPRSAISYGHSLALFNSLFV